MVSHLRISNAHVDCHHSTLNISDRPWRTVRFVPLRITARRGPFRIAEYEREMLMSPDSGCELRAPGI